MISQEKVDELIKELNRRLPFRVSAHAKPSVEMPNVINILIVENQQIIEAYGLSETLGTVYWFKNELGRYY